MAAMTAGQPFPDEKYAIADLERLSGIKAHTLRAWEKRYGLIDPQRTATNIRYYTRADLRRLLNVALLVHQGGRISELAGLDDEQLHQRVLALDQAVSDQESGITALVSAMVDYDESAFHQQFNQLSERFGFERVMVEIVYPFLERIGVLWVTWQVNPAQEHFVTHLIRQKLIAAIDALPEADPKAPSFLLYLPEGELHEMSLLFGHYLIKRRGGRVVYLGQNVPIEDLLVVIKQRQPDYLLTHLTSPEDRKAQIAKLERVASAIGQKTLFVSGHAPVEPAFQATNIIVLATLADFKTRLSGLLSRAAASR